MIDMKAPLKFMLIPIHEDMEASCPVIVEVGENNVIHLRRADGVGNVTGLFPAGGGIDVMSLRMIASEGGRKRKAA